MLDPVDDLDDVRTRLALNVDDDGRDVIGPGGEKSVLGAFDNRCDIGQADGSAVAVSDDRIGERFDLVDLIVGVDREGPEGPVEAAFRRIDVDVAENRAEVVDQQAVGRKRPEIGLDTHRRPMASRERHEAHARDLGNFLGERRLGEILDLGQRPRLGGQGERQHGSVGRIDLGIDGRRRQIRRQEVGRSVDGGLDLLLGHVEREAEGELQGDDGRATRARRRHLVQARHLPELALERRRDGRRHHLGAGAGIESLDLDCRIVDLGERGYRELRVGNHAR